MNLAAKSRWFRCISRFRYSWKSNIVPPALVFKIFHIRTSFIKRLLRGANFTLSVFEFGRHCIELFDILQSKLETFFWLSYRLQQIVNTSRHGRNHWMEECLEHRFLDRERLVKHSQGHVLFVTFGFLRAWCYVINVHWFYVYIPGLVWFSSW